MTEDKNEILMKKIRKHLGGIFLLIIILVGTAFISTDKAYAADLYETEDNDTVETANEVSFGNNIFGNMKTKDDIDYYKFTVTSNGVADFTLAHASLDQNFDFTISVYQYENGSYTEITSTSIWSGKCQFTLGLKPNTYYVAVNAGAIASANGKYVMSAAFKERNDWEKEFNDSSETANEVKVGSDIYGTMKTSGDFDYYKFSLKKPAIVQLGLAHTDINQYFDFDITVYQYKDGSYNEITSGSARSADQKYRSQELKLSSGIYYIKVNAGAMASKYGKYKLDLDYVVKPTAILNITTLQHDKIKINYKKVAYVTGYEIYRMTKKDGKYVCIKKISSNKISSYTDEKVKKGQTYYYKVRTYYKDGSKSYYSTFSKAKGITVAK